jgi:peptide/nickel transport system substrate-binding protein
MGSLARILGACLGVAGALGTAPAMAQKSADTLRVAWRDAIPNVDPYMNSLRTGLIVEHQAWDGLTYRDPDGFVIKPALAKSWKWADPVTLEFELRPGVKFSNGDPFTAADVVYTVQLATDPKAGIAVPSNFSWMAGAEAIDDLHVRIKLKKPFPAAMEYVSFVLPIEPKAYREKVGPEGYAKAPIGIGPYRITKVDGINEIDMVRNENYYADSPKGRPAIGRLVIKEVADASTELTSLLSGQADWIWQFSPDQFDKLNSVPTIKAMRGQSMRIVFLDLDAAGRTGADNPLTKLKVRQAIFHAVDRDKIAKELVQGGAIVPDGPCYPTQFGCDTSAEVKYPYDPAKAKQLLAEAGYPNGFDTELVHAIVPQWAAAVQNYLNAVGIRARLTTLQAGAAVQRSEDGKTPLYGSSWGSYSINDVSAIMPYFFSGNVDDYARDPEVTKLLVEAGTMTNPDDRKKNYSAALKRITEQAYWMPISSWVNTYAMSKNLNFKPWPDEMPRFYLSSWN